jgi:DNA-binding MarR family transcriptional regulator
MASVFLAEHRVRLFKRGDRPSRFWQAAFRLSGRARPLVKSTGQADLAGAKRWAMDFLARLSVPSATIATQHSREDLLAPYPFPRIRQRKRHVERELALRTLSAYHHNPLIAQRRLAEALTVSLAIVNAYTTRCVKSGWLLKLARPSGRGRGYRYVLTEAGHRQMRELLAAYVAQELSLFRALVADFGTLCAAADGRPVFLSSEGDLAAIARLARAEAGQPAPRIQATANARDRAMLRRGDAVLWLTDAGGDQPPAAAALGAPALLREFGIGRNSRATSADVRSKTKV